MDFFNVKAIGFLSFSTGQTTARMSEALYSFKISFSDLTLIIMQLTYFTSNLLFKIVCIKEI